MIHVISPEAEAFLIQNSFLQENFTRSLLLKIYAPQTVPHAYQLSQRIIKFDLLFWNMLYTTPAYQDWDFVIEILEQSLQKTDEFFTWIAEPKKYHTQATPEEYEQLIRYQYAIYEQIVTLKHFIEEF